MIRLYCIGLFILIIAIIANSVVVKIGILSWYDFLNYLSDKEASDIEQVKLIDYLWLFIGYPFVLGLGYIAGKKVYELIF
ncbi:MAG: hypothetical protein KJN66_10505 [Bacteroidia bacterium]|nr:hypothetical protein [Bacteroidia bacterium]